MAKLTKDQYDRRRENAAQSNIENEKIAMKKGMNEHQAELISELCSLRHDMHSDKPINNDDNNYKKKLVELNIEIKESGIKQMDFIPSGDVSEYIDIDTIDELYVMGEVPEEDDKREKWRQTEFDRISEELHGLNNNIEEYLREIDNKYGTSFSPTGWQRIL